ncbi:hypothetical protein [Synechocystis sp. PCC 7509]|uniref:hypothetical protein n=1 Tax=Synechocystis sp. PCC 7509 TaxID=927677 RepID=UPI0002ACBEAC|nr:hypothetical protein [Synechocystis sp. PCC 7509]
MVNVFKYNWFWGLFATLIILFSLTVFSNWVLLGCIWFAVFFIFRFSNLEKNLSSNEHRLYLTTAFVFPIIETWLTWMIQKDIIPYSWFWLNRLEHFFSALGVVIILLPIYINIWHKLKWWQSLIFVLGLICIIGNLNEFFEFFLRVCCKPIKHSKFAVYYPDTIYDMGVNLMGGLVGFLIIKLNVRPL